ncbi:hypothetical protein GDO86_004244 [Hymenochirus boettgeri]|uniref:peptidylprolyl isomerase n=1 Tax=Hymenochirus boettgeri TaxID=247094 RepID=A0A8T2KAD7_9PIPI|nr:hypothetical protein GDO86_004244 [Hymenochirus boettgeri]
MFWGFAVLLLLSPGVLRAENEEESSENVTELLIETLGRLDDGHIIDSSLSRDPLVVEIGKKQVIPGLEKSLIGMCVGEKRKVVIPPHLAYGKKGFPPTIPGDSVLQFETEVMALFKLAPWQNLWNRVFSMLCICLVPTLLGLIGYHLYSKSKFPATSKKKQKEEKRNKAKKK